MGHSINYICYQDGDVFVFVFWTSPIHRKHPQRTRPTHSTMKHTARVLLAPHTPPSLSDLEKQTEQAQILRACHLAEYKRNENHPAIYPIENTKGTP